MFYRIISGIRVRAQYLDTDNPIQARQQGNHRPEYNTQDAADEPTCICFVSILVVASERAAEDVCYEVAKGDKGIDTDNGMYNNHNSKISCSDNGNFWSLLHLN